MEKKFNVGDRVMCTDDGNVGVVKEIDETGCVVAFDNGEDTWLEAYLLVPNNEKHDKATKFLTELHELLRKYDASFVDYECYDVTFSVGNDIDISFKVKKDGDVVNAENLFELAEVKQY